MKKKIITFYLPSLPEFPMGGFKIVFEYANRLAEKGYKVNLVFFGGYRLKKLRRLQFLKYICLKKIAKNFLNWFKLDKRVKIIAIPKEDEIYFPKGDVVFATGRSTSDFVSRLSNEYGEKYYLIQGFENWDVDDEKVISSYKLGLKNIVVSRWLYNIVKNISDVELISNPIDTEVFYVDNDIKLRNKYNLAMLYHTSKKKGIFYALEAIKIAKEKYSNIKLDLFGVSDEPDFLEEWMTYTQKATEEDLKKIYNKTSIFVCGSVEEGFGLTGAESMACGCALVSTDYLGVHEYAVNNVNSLLSPVKNSEILANNIIKLIENDELRWRLAIQGSLDIRKRNWDGAVNKLIGLIEK